MFAHLITDKNPKGSYYPEMKTYKQEVYSLYNKLAVI